MFRAFKDRRQSKEEQVDELLSAYVDGLLTSDERATLEDRFQQEAALRERLEALRFTISALANLPEVETPRNFLLSPSMVARVRPAAKPRRRPAWPVFGWAAAAATLLFFLVFASDVFVVAPSVRPQPTVIVLQESELLIQTPVDREVRSAADASAMAPDEIEVTVQVEVEKEAVLAVEAPEEVVEPEMAVAEEAKVETAVATSAPAAARAVEEEATQATEAPVEMVGAEPGAPVAEGGEEVPTDEAGEEMLQVEITSTEEAGISLAQQTLEFRGTPAPGDVVTPVFETEVIITAVPPAAEAKDEAPVVVSPPGDTEQVESDSGPRAVPQQVVSPEAVAAVPLSVTPSPTDARQAAEDVLPWLRLVEVMLGSAIVGLVTAMLVLRWREAR